MRWLRLMIFASLVITAFLAVGIALLLNSDLTRFKGAVARIISAQNDRDIVIDGNFQFDAQPTKPEYTQLLTEEQSSH
jgi:hypothetical protein